MACISDFNEAVIRPGDAAVLDEAITSLKRIPVVINVNGYCDAIGDEEYNLRLSRYRGNAVANYLLNGGIQATQLRVHGYGKTDFVATNKTAEGRAEPSRRAGARELGPVEITTSVTGRSLARGCGRSLSTVPPALPDADEGAHFCYRNHRYEVRTKCSNGGSAVAAFAFVALIGASPGCAQSQAPYEAASTAPVAAPDSTAPAATAASPATKKTLGQKVKSLVAKLTPERIKRDIEFRKASALFPDFCKHWEQDCTSAKSITSRNCNSFRRKATKPRPIPAMARSPAASRISRKMVYSIGKISYEEFEYYIAGKSEDEARHAQPKTVSDTHTTEIFRWDNGKWFY